MAKTLSKENKYSIPLCLLPSLITRKMRKQKNIHQVADLMVKDGNGDKQSFTCRTQ